MAKIGRSLLGVLVFVWSVVAFADVKVTAELDRQKVNQGETFNYIITVESTDSVSVGEPRLPSLTGVSLLDASKSSSSSTSFINGKFEYLQTLRYVYVLQAEQVGKHQIGTTEVVVDSKSYLTAAVNVEVVAGGAPAPPIAGGGGAPQSFDPFADDIFDQLLQRGNPPGGFKTQPVNPNEAFFIQVDVDKSKVYEGEQVTASWYLYTRGNVLTIDTLKYPSLNGFWKEDIEVATRLDFTNEMYDGVVYRKALLASYALFPIKSGQGMIDPYKARCQVITPSNFGLRRANYYTKSSKPVKVEILPLPKEGQPADFTGAVGQFEVTAKLDSEVAKVDQPVTLLVRFDGKGNAKLIDLPTIDFPSHFEVYDTQKESHFEKDGSSHKEFKVLLIPRQQGDYEIPSFSVSFFDPDRESYYTKTIPSLPIKVAPGDGTKAISDAPLAETGAGEKLPAIVEPPLSLAWSSGPLLTKTQRATLWSAVFSFILLFLGWQSRMELGWGRKRQDLEQLLRLRLKVVHQHLDKGDWRQVGVSVMNTMYMVLGEVSGEKGASEEIEKMFLKAPPSVRREVAEPLQKLMQSFEVLAFAPESVVGPLKDPKKLKDLVQAVDKVLFKAVRLGVGTEEMDSSAKSEKNV
ncbi:MAG: protein BatD [Pseudobdellovibrionaceae bacterium]|nr:protein BatD [Bdellovibrionales bacterium]USN47530.1 MAG: protein BatD [Pseudobdellovibrionaceae bacterium]